MHHTYWLALTSTCKSFVNKNFWNKIKFETSSSLHFSLRNSSFTLSPILLRTIHCISLSTTKIFRLLKNTLLAATSCRVILRGFPGNVMLICRLKVSGVDLQRRVCVVALGLLRRSCSRVAYMMQNGHLKLYKKNCTDENHFMLCMCIKYAVILLSGRGFTQSDASSNG